MNYSKMTKALLIEFIQEQDKMIIDKDKEIEQLEADKDEYEKLYDDAFEFQELAETTSLKAQELWMKYHLKDILPREVLDLLDALRDCHEKPEANINQVYMIQVAV